jgi:hypothetical protein
LFYGKNTIFNFEIYNFIIFIFSVATTLQCDIIKPILAKIKRR